MYSLMAITCGLLFAVLSIPVRLYCLRAERLAYQPRCSERLPLCGGGGQGSCVPGRGEPF